LIRAWRARRGLDQCSFFHPPPSPQAGKDALDRRSRAVVMRFQGNGFNEQMFGAE
jgi:hypothetical protein